ncbi:MAG TPA: DUF3482 domain-containing protein, partial [Desulfobacteraceae bacterium]|nr:DUF3482 domain-containing protein [Desulfobacteraceae bacterium]
MIQHTSVEPVRPDASVPEFAVLGHPNEGKSSVVSTLTEDDNIRVSQVPGETTVSRAYTVKIDSREIIRFVDTPGFQAPRQTLAWFRENAGAGIVDRFLAQFKTDPFFADECELLTPVARGAGIIYVVDGSRPVRDDDLAEMEILRLTGRPRMAVINSKSLDRDYTDEWKAEFRKHFNVIRVFNSNRADFYERIRMLESLKAIDQDWEKGLESVIRAFKDDWERRNRMACAYITHGIETMVGYVRTGKVTSRTDPVRLKEDLVREYQQEIRNIEKTMFSHIRELFRHKLFDYPLPEYSVLRHDLFSDRTWEVLGLTRGQLTTAGALVGGTVGAVLDTAAAGLTFGVFTAIGSALGAGSALMGVKKITQRGGKGLAGDRLRVGPNENIQFMYVLMDRAILYYTHMVRRSHGRRDMPAPAASDKPEKMGVSTGLTPAQQKICAAFFRRARGKA